MPIIVENKICIFEPWTFQYHLSGTAPSAIPGGGRIYVEDPLGIALEMVLPDARGSVQQIAANSADRTLPVGDHISRLVLEENVKNALQPVDLVLNTEPRILPPDPDPCKYLGADITPEPPLFDFVRDLDVYNRAHLVGLARVLQQIGVDWVNAGRVALSLPRTSENFELRGERINANFGSGTIIFNTSRRTIVWIYGTTTNEQLARQGADMIRGPYDVGPFGAGYHWLAGAHRVMGSLNTFMGYQTQNFTFVGHSMGGAVASICAVLMKMQSRQTEVEVVTFGSPKPGDQRFVDLLSRTAPRRMHIENAYDVIPYFCPNLYKPGPKFPNWKNIIKDILTAGSEAWRGYNDFWLLDEDGTLIYKGEKVDLNVLLTAATKLFVGGKLETGFTHHYMSQYLGRLLLRLAEPIQPPGN